MFRALTGWLIPASLRNRIAAAALAIGLAERLFWAFSRKMPFATDEAANVAIALAEGRGFADAYFPGQGPTAHLLPTAPAIAALVYRLCGVRTPLAEVLLLGWSLLLVFGTYLLFARIMERLGAAPRGVLAGFVLLAVVPVYTAQEVFDFRIWESGLALALGAALLAVLLAAEQGDPPRGLGWWLALLPALLFFVHPPLGLAGVAALLWFLWRRRDWRFAVRSLAGSALVVALLVGGWALRNERALGEPVLLRSNLGLELAVGNFPGMVAPADPEQVFYGRLRAIHPYNHSIPYAAMRAAGGEIAYSRRLGQDTTAWMRAHPAAVARIWGQHVSEMLFTRVWLFQTAHGVWLPPFRAGFVALLAVLGLLRLGLAVARREGRYGYIAAFVVVPVLCFLPFQPILRYTWLLYPALTYLALDLVVLMTRRMRPTAR